MNLLQFVDFKVKVLRVFGHCALIKSPTRQGFIFNWFLYTVQMIGWLLFLIIKTKLQEYEYSIMADELKYTANEYFLQKYLDEAHSNADTVLTYTLMLIHDTYLSFVWLILIMIRFRSKKNYAEIYNSVIKIDQDIKSINPTSLYVKLIKQKHLRRWIILIFVFSILAMDEFQSYSLKRSYTEKVTSVILRLVWYLVYDQQITVYEILTVQLKALTKILNYDHQPVEVLEKSHRLLSNMIQTKLLIDHSFNKQFIIDLFGCCIFIVSLLYWEVVMLENLDQFDLPSFEYLLRERMLMFISCWVLYDFLIIYETKQELGKLAAKLNQVCRTSRSEADFYSLINFGELKHNFIATNQFISTAGRKTLFKVSCKIEFNRILSLVFDLLDF